MRGGQTFRAGDWVEVRPADEVLATLDNQGCLEQSLLCRDGPILRATIPGSKLAHKTCDPTGCTDLRRMADAVHLDTRCDGSGHDGCEAGCLLFWKTAWLMPVDGPAANAANPPVADSADLDRLRSATRSLTADGGGIRYRCQATEIVRATTALPSSEVRQYVEDVATRNVPPTTFVWYFASAISKMVVSRLVRLIRPRRNVPMPSPTAKTSEIFNLQPGEIVQVRTAREIVTTLNKNWKNRGLSFEKRCCGIVVVPIACCAGSTKSSTRNQARWSG